MFKHQLSLLAIATILLSATLVNAADIGEETNLSVGNIRVQTSNNGGVKIQTPNLTIDTAKSALGQVITSRNRRRYRIPATRRGRVLYPTATTVHQRVIGKVAPAAYPDRRRNSTIRTSNNDTHTMSEQHIECHGSSSSISQSSQTINGRTVSSEVHSSCN
jgi:hypothetical protein